MSKTTRVLFLATVSSFAIGAARADVIYTGTFIPTYQSKSPGYAARGTDFVLDLTDAQVETGAFALRGLGQTPSPGGNGSPSYSGDIGGFISLSTDQFTARATPTSFPSYNGFNISMTFASGTGEVLSDSISYFGPSDDAILSGTGALTTGAIGSDGPWCNSDALTGDCTVTGSISVRENAAIPEPLSFIMLGTGLLGLAALRRPIA